MGFLKRHWKVGAALVVGYLIAEYADPIPYIAAKFKSLTGGQ